MEFSSIYLSRILGNKIYNEQKEVIGILKDLAVITEPVNPKVLTAQVKTKEGIKFLNWSYFSVSEQKGQFVLSCSKIEETQLNNLMLLKRYVLDKQIIDVNGRKVVRVNDVRLVFVNSDLVVAAVDIGAEGLLRRLALAKPAKFLGFKIPSKLMLWTDVATTFTNTDIILSKTYDKLSVLHPSDLADIIEDFDANTGMIIFSGFDNSTAADVLEELEEDVQMHVLNHLPIDKAADILEEMPADEVADILDGMENSKVEELLNYMERDASHEVRGLLQYDDNLVGSLMTKDFIMYSKDFTVKQALDNIKEINPPEDMCYYIYVVGDDAKLLGAIALINIFTSDSNLTLERIMNRNHLYMFDKDEVDDLIKDICKYSLLAVPIVNDKKHLIGQVVISDVLYELMKHQKRIG